MVCYRRCREARGNAAAASCAPEESRLLLKSAAARPVPAGPPEAHEAEARRARVLLLGPALRQRRPCHRAIAAGPVGRRGAALQPEAALHGAALLRHRHPLPHRERREQREQRKAKEPRRARRPRRGQRDELRRRLGGSGGRQRRRRGGGEQLRLLLQRRRVLVCRQLRRVERCGSRRVREESRRGPVEPLRLELVDGLWLDEPGGGGGGGAREGALQLLLVPPRLHLGEQRLHRAGGA
mmetsp:Transcript_505/g.1409  ORF Transcript_505/g.1409 Transcript_505/m.1409 type:complete len:239 (-) Transcript_505:393-1109(-)